MSLTRPDIDIHPKTFPASALKARTYDVVVIGGGPAGLTTSLRIAQGGFTALLIESELVGGECLYWACVPSKALLRASEAIQNVTSVGGAREKLELLAKKYGVPARPEVDLDGLWARRDMFVRRWQDDSLVNEIHGAGVDTAHGFGRLSGVRKVEIKDWHSGNVEEVEARHAVVIATGSAPLIPQIDGLENSKYWTAREAVSAQKVPEHLIILGAGAVGTEMATLYNQIGSKVTLIAHSILPKVVPQAGNMIQESLGKAGVDVILGLELVKVNRTDAMVEAVLSDGSVVKGTEILVATGRKAQITGMMLEQFGGPIDGGWAKVDDSMCVSSVPEGWLYAVGDLNGRALMTHIAKYQAKLAANSIIAKAKGTYQREVSLNFWNKLTAKPTGLAIAQSIFTDPQIAACGLTPEQATARGMKIRVVSVSMSDPGSMLHAENYQGWAQWVVDDAGYLIGATFVGRDAVDLLQASTMAIVGKMTVEQIWHVTPPFPTMSEVYTTLSEAVEAAVSDVEKL
ncbi:hypothetical protein H2198_006683 [Neophaeococcomyces mojaviensis]|uniref:Uncharacterized protein n=1 Tax=Neophaeococcomyces mojaviensis TaxID=3383035 RepID=A0ACC3A260_9EURO|nr:hypothetical protein H2198_006683 [Knufia sp. JES_112]